ncbi:hypothetical protein Tsp_02296 [Trichinella spiralis]|uniref:hypothetical protein n=1 Tax=Trichinella spiralis TaxID=6334 RepID=UPI0001EFCCAC|nr:hypothetical protein Tsp_02296 [Trichinella spiralis]
MSLVNSFYTRVKIATICSYKQLTTVKSVSSVVEEKQIAETEKIYKLHLPRGA